jgi:amino-acid N-acetyltransferase
MNVAIRPARPGELPTIVRLLEASKLSASDVDEFLETFLVAEVDGAIVGTIGLECYGGVGLLRSAAVDIRLQRNGIGDQLVNALIDVARRRGIRELVLMTETAEQFFAYRGFTAIPRQTVTGDVRQSSQFHGACPDTAVLMRMVIESLDRMNHAETKSAVRVRPQ